MKAARLVVLGVAVVAGGLAALLASGGDETPPPPKPTTQIDTVEILTAKGDIGIGSAVTAADLGWSIWPTSSAGPNFIRKSDRPDAIDQLAGAIARMTFSAGEPIRESKLIKASGSGYMAAILPSGMRAVSTEISPETGAGGFILPNDHVDVILSRRDKQAEKATGAEVVVSETILTNIRVLAIDQTVEDKNGQKVVVGKTTTLEVTPSQVETLALARQIGTVSLALRSIADEKKDSTDDDDRGSRQGINMVRFGVTTTATPK
ncbi:MAG: Flp pilus assembly protein CpaB [Rhizobiales bacterium]|nr:Flp pilus assembly protein CpaB [Hyphomicrobiales bacterium]